MPIRNIGTLLEHIVVVESARIILNRVSHRGLVEFVNCFAMPPFSRWKDNQKDAGYSVRELEGLESDVPIEDTTSYPGLLRTCLRTQRGGPNAALLVGLLASLQGKRMRMWLNDLADERAHYPNAVPQLHEIEDLLATLAPSRMHSLEVVACGDPYPRSLTTLQRVLSDWRQTEPATVRLGFLDPMKYTIERDKAAIDHTTSLDHQEWLAVLRGSGDIPVLSAHFTADQNQPALGRELTEMRTDGIKTGYPLSLEFRHGHYVVAISFMGNADHAKVLAEVLEGAVRRVWNNWFTDVAKRKSPFALSVKRHPPHS